MPKTVTYITSNPDKCVTVNIKTVVNKKYVTAENAGAQALIANRDVIGPWETFTIIKTGDCSANIYNNGICDTAEGETSITCPADCGGINSLTGTIGL